MLTTASSAQTQFRVLSDAFVRSQPLLSKGQQKVWDAGAPGLALKIGKRRKSWVVRYRPVPGREREVTIGHYPELGIAEARRRAREIRSRALDGGDPLVQKAERRIELDPKSSFRAVIEQYWATDLHHRQLRRRRQEERLIELHVLPQWRDRPITGITSADALDLLEALACKYPIQANRVLHALRRPFRWAVQRRLTKASPIADIERLAPENKRERVLHDEEIRRIWNASTSLGVFGCFIRCLLLTGARRDELRSADWAEFDFKQMVWSRPASRMKGKRSHALPVTPLLHEVLDSLPSERRGHVFSTTEGRRAYGALSRAKRKLDLESGVSHWTLHDLRRTVRTKLAEIGVPFEIAERVLAHGQHRIEQVYNLHHYMPEKRDALLKWESKLKNLLRL
jgi:integrase